VIRALFILKLREDYSTDLENFRYPSVASGMYNSATFVSNMLVKYGVESKVVTVVDNNSIDKEVYDYKPSHVFIEGYWVVPEKFTVLKKLHPKVVWTVRCHSETPFLSTEGSAMGWTFGYRDQGVHVAANSYRMQEDFKTIAGDLPLFPLLPNYYPTKDFKVISYAPNPAILNIGCFGALRPLKNHLVQAVAAIAFANKYGKTLNFHINSAKDTPSQGALKNIRNLFLNQESHKLIEHEWTGHEEFLKLLSTMDMSMQVSFSETFNIVSADALSQGCRILTSAEVPFIAGPTALPTSTPSVVHAMEKVWNHTQELNAHSKVRMKDYNKTSAALWMSFMTGKEIRKENLVHKFWIKLKNFLPV
jgi:hypothetical protein